MVRTALTLCFPPGRELIRAASLALGVRCAWSLTFDGLVAMVHCCVDCSPEQELTLAAMIATGVSSARARPVQACRPITLDHSCGRRVDGADHCPRLRVHGTAMGPRLTECHMERRRAAHHAGGHAAA